jgi:hypothetical protein
MNALGSTRTHGGVYNPVWRRLEKLPWDWGHTPYNKADLRDTKKNLCKSD